MKLHFFILEVVLAQKEMSHEEAKNWKQPTYWEAMTQVGIQNYIGRNTWECILKRDEGASLKFYLSQIQIDGDPGDILLE